MKISRYLCIRFSPLWKEKYKPDARLTTNPPNLRANEIALRLNLEIPDELFLVPALEATIKVPAGAGIPPELRVTDVRMIQEAIKKELGIDLDINIVEEKGK